ncbi:MAG: 30S ribosome-binding factor RbfA [Candidatus Accumulibacter sp.]|jgi:ribosome-binding factor A|nr:30S ribosome-binding factor RbfA [Accumulibacter sp.]
MSEHRSFSRRERVAEQIRRDLSDLIRQELKDPRVGMISLTSVEVSADYAHAKIFFSTLDTSERVPEILAGLEKASGFLRRELGKRISTHLTPQLHFIFDASIERGAELSELIRQAISLSDAAP